MTADRLVVIVAYLALHCDVCMHFMVIFLVCGSLDLRLEARTVVLRTCLLESLMMQLCISMTVLVVDQGVRGVV